MITPVVFVPVRARLACAAVALAAACSGLTGPTERLRTYEVAEARVPCQGMVPMQCLQVRVPPATAWEYFYDSIDGFTYEPGYRYVLRVAERDVPNPPADGSSVAYRLVRLVSKTPVAP